MLLGAPTLDAMPLESFLGPACVLDIRGHDPIEIQHLEPYGPTLERCVFAILRTGWAERWHSPDYFQDYPALTPEAARWLTGFPLRGVGVDAISVDRHDSSDYPVHHTLFASNLIVIENLCNLDALAGSIFILSALPLKLPQADGSPVRAVALLV